MAEICKNCGAELNAYAAFCSRCGCKTEENSLESQPISAPPAASIPPPAASASPLAVSAPPPGPALTAARPQQISPGGAQSPAAPPASGKVISFFSRLFNCPNLEQKLPPKQTCCCCFPALLAAALALLLLFAYVFSSSESLFDSTPAEESSSGTAAENEPVPNEQKSSCPDESRIGETDPSVPSKADSSDEATPADTAATEVPKNGNSGVYVFNFAECSRLSYFEIKAIEESLRNVPLTVSADGSFLIKGEPTVYKANAEENNAVIEVTDLVIKGRLGDKIRGKNSEGWPILSGECIPVSGKLHTLFSGKNVLCITRSQNGYNSNHKDVNSDYEQEIVGKFKIADEIAAAGNYYLKLKCPCDMAMCEWNDSHTETHKNGGSKDNKAKAKAANGKAEGNSSAPRRSRQHKTITLLYSRKDSEP
ncbi:hypothetical protein IJT93_08805 [bacterium]|nr:hypothetical protein [bacterium]